MYAAKCIIKLPLSMYTSISDIENYSGPHISVVAARLSYLSDCKMKRTQTYQIIWLMATSSGFCNQRLICSIKFEEYKVINHVKIK